MDSTASHSTDATLPPELHRLATVVVPVSVQIGHQKMSLQSLCSLAPGVVIPLEISRSVPPSLSVGGLTLATGEAVRQGRQIGFRVLELPHSRSRERSDVE